MPLSDLDCANLCLSQYNGEEIFDYNFSCGGDYTSIKIYDDCAVIVHEGSHDAPNWFNNFNAIMRYIPDFAGVEQGFYVNIPAISVQALPILPKDKIIYVTGHSRGAARAHIFAAILIKQGYKVEVVTFGSPRPGDRALADILATAPNRSYFNYHDIDDQDYVCDVPFDITLIAPFVHPGGRIQIDETPQTGDPWLMLSRHHIELYIKGLQNGS